MYDKLPEESGYHEEKMAAAKRGELSQIIEFASEECVTSMMFAAQVQLKEFFWSEVEDIQEHVLNNSTDIILKDNDEIKEVFKTMLNDFNEFRHGCGNVTKLRDIFDANFEELKNIVSRLVTPE